MTLLDVLFLLLVAGISGAMGQMLGGYSRGGCLVAVALGFAGATVGVLVAKIWELPAPLSLPTTGDAAFPLLWALLGAAVAVAPMVNLMSRRPQL